MTAEPEQAPPTAPPEGDFARVHPLSPLLRGGLLVVALAIAFGRGFIDGGEGGTPWEWLLVPVSLVGGVAVGAVSWWFTRYRVGADELRIDSGVLMRRSRRIRLDRIQAIEVQQPFLARVFGMASLAIETAGGGDTEATLAYLTLRQANQLRHHLLVEAGREGGQPDATDTGGDADAGPDEILHRVEPGLLLASQLLRTGPLAAGLAATAALVAGTAAGAPVTALAALPFLITVVTPVYQGFTAGYGFTVRRSSRGLSVRAGLFGLRTAALPVQRIRGLSASEPIVWRWFGWVALRVTVAGVVVRTDEDARLSTTLVPVARRPDAQRLIWQVLPGLHLDGIRLTPPPRQARWIDPYARRVLALGGDEQHVVTRRGLLTRRTDVAPRVAVQSCGLRQGPLQRRLGLATVGVHLPSGPAAPVGVHRDAAEAWTVTLTTAQRPPQRAPQQPLQPAAPPG